MNISQRWRTASLLFLIIALGAALRLTGLDRESLWGDELFRWNQAHVPSVSTVIRRDVSFDPHPPLYRTLLYFVEKYLGESEIALRSSSVLFGIAAIPAIFWLGARLYTEREGLIAAALLAVLWAPNYYSQDAGPYALLTLLSILSVGLWWRILHDLFTTEAVPSVLALEYGFVALSTMYLHYYGVLLILIEGVGAALLFRRSRQAFIALLKLYMSLGLLYLPWAVVVVCCWHARAGKWIPAPESLALSARQFLRFAF